ncbi:MAG: M28 family peptidase [FCB group bacterium]|nr:M28 family peptidase [FCB group bacterium]
MPILLLVFFLAAAALGNPFSGENAIAYIDTLCSEEFAGRKSGDPEAALAEKWVADKFSESGLTPGGSDGYFQSFPILNNTEKKAGLTLINGYHGKKKYVQGEDFHVITNSGSGKVRAEVVFIGYSIEEPDLDYNDFVEVDLAGKIALIYQEVPNGDRIWADLKFREYKVNNAMEHGAAAIIFVRGKYPLSGVAIKDNAFYPEIPMMLVGEHVAVDIFRGTGKNFEQGQKALKNGSQSFNTGKVGEGVTKMEYNPDAEAANVIGVIPGSDPVLGQEWVIVGGHLDHNGVNAAGDVFHGADDNASGAAIVMELARCFGALEIPPRRSMIFIAFAAEEQGLLGSKYYVENPMVPLEYTAGMFNFDCCGIGDGTTGFGGKEHFPEVWDAYKPSILEEDEEKLMLGTCWGYGSDKAFFEKWGVSSFNYWSSGSRPFYHQAEDLPDQISFDAVNNVGRMSYDFISFFADWEEPLVSEYLRTETLLKSAQSIDLSEPLRFGNDVFEEEILAEIRGLRKQGLKSKLAGLHGDDLYRELDRWRTFCDENDLRWITNGDQLNSAIRKEEFALFPVLCGIDKSDIDVLTLKMLFDLEVRTIYLDDDFEESGEDSVILKTACDLGVVFILGGGAKLPEVIPGDARVIRNFDDASIPMVEAEDFNADKVRYVIRPGAVVPGEFLAENDRLFHLNPGWGDSAESRIGAIDEYFGQIEGAGLERRDIKYMLGDNVLEMLKW